MIYAITDENGAFLGIYDSIYGDLTPTELFIQIDAGTRQSLLENPKQEWTGEAWQQRTLTLDEQKANKHKILDGYFAQAKIVNWTRGEYSGSGWMNREQRMQLNFTATLTTGVTHFVFEQPVGNRLEDVLPLITAIEQYEYELEVWYKNNKLAIESAVDLTALSAINLTDSQPSVPTLVIS